MAADNQSPAEPTAEPALLALARKNFGALSGAEEELFRAAQEGRAASALASEEKENDPANAANWLARRAVRAECIAWVCTDPHALAFMTHYGLDLNGMRIDGELNLGDAELKFPFAALKCAFSADIFLQDAQLQGFHLVDCQLKSLRAARAVFNSTVVLHGKDFAAEGEVNLAGATILGDLSCSEAHFSNKGGAALDANSAKIGGSVYLRAGFNAEGEVNLVGARIGGNLECDGAKFLNANDLALDVDMAKIEGSVFLRNRFKAEGKVNLLGATIDGLLQIHDVLEAKRTIFDLTLTKVGTFWDDERSWPEAKKLRLDGFRYERLYEDAPFEADKRKKWLSLQPPDRFRPQPYEQLAAVLRQMGHEPEARQIMIEKNRERAKFTKFPHQSWWWYNAFGRLIGYGYAPWRAFCLSLGMIFLGYFLFYLGSTHGLISPTSDKAYAKAPNGQVIIEKGGQKISEEYPVFHPLVYSVESFTPLLKLDQSAHWTPNANRSTEISIFCRQVLISRHVPFPGRFLRYYLYFHIASGWLLTSLWVGAITGLVKT